MARTVSKADRELFREAMSGVRRLKSAGDRRDTAAAASKVDRRLRPQVTKARTKGAGGANPTTSLREQRASRCKPDLKALQRGRIRVDANLDLHGFTAEAARRRLHQFLDEALAERLSCVRIVHGKGLRSGPAGPVLKTLVHATLRSLDGVGGYTDAPAADGGSGATLVLLHPVRAQRPR